MILFANATVGGTSQIKTYNAVDHIVAPATMLLEGVQYHPINGQIWPILAPADAIIESASAWNGIALTADHPVLNGQRVMLESPESFEKFHIGSVFNVEPLENGIHGEVWLNTQQADVLGGNAAQLAERLRGNEKTENSTGYRADVTAQAGMLKTVPYAAIQSNIRPNHHALLLNKRGQCDLGMGCGVFNCSGTHTPLSHDQAAALLLNTPFAELQHFASGLGIYNVKNYFDIIRAVEDKLYALEGFDSFRGMESINQNTLVYRKEVDGSVLYFRRTYAMSAAGVVTFGDPEQVRKNVTFPIVESGTAVTNTSDTTEEETAMAIGRNRPVLVNQVISNEAFPWKEGDRTFLETLEDEQFEKFFHVEGDKIILDPPPQATPGQEAGTESASAPTGSSRQQEQQTQGSDQPQQAMLNADAEEYRRTLLQGAQVEKERIAGLLLANEACPFSKEELLAKPLKELKDLEKVATPARPAARFSGRKVPVLNSGTEEGGWEPAPGDPAFAEAHSKAA